MKSMNRNEDLEVERVLLSPSSFLGKVIGSETRQRAYDSGEAKKSK